MELRHLILLIVSLILALIVLWLVYRSARVLYWSWRIKREFSKLGVVDPKDELEGD